MEPTDTLFKWWPAILLALQLINGLAIWAVWSLKRSTISPEELNTLSSSITESIKILDAHVKNEIGKQNERITVLEGDVKGLPKHDDLKDIHARLGGVSRQLSEVVGATSAMANQTATIYQYLLTLNGKGTGQ